MPGSTEFRQVSATEVSLLRVLVCETPCRHRTMGLDSSRNHRKKLVDDGPLSRIARAPQNLTYLFTYLLSTLKACSQPPNGNSIELEFSTVQFSLVRRLWTFLEWKPRNRGLTADRNFSRSTRGGCAPSSTDVISARTTANGLLASDPVRLQFTLPPPSLSRTRTNRIYQLYRTTIWCRK